MKPRLFILVIITLLSCTEENEVQSTKKFSIEIIGRVPFCPLTVIEFQLSDLKELEKITGQIGELRCQTYNLPENFNQIGQKLTVTIRKTMDEEYFPCITLGPSYPYSWVTIIKTIDK